MELRRIPSGALAGAVAAAVWAAQQPLDKRVFGSDYDDVELLGKLVTRDSGWQAAGLAEHVATWPLTALVDRQLAGDRRAFAQSAWRHALFGMVLGEVERRLNPKGQFEPLEQVPVSS